MPADDSPVTIRPSLPRPFASLVVLVTTMLVAALLAAPALAQDEPAEDSGRAEESPPDPADGDDEADEAPTSEGDEGDDDEDEDDESEDDGETDCDEDAGATESEGDDESDPCDPGPQQVSLADLVSPAPIAIDIELQAALTSIDFLDTWYAVTSTHPRLSLVTVSSPAADAGRATVLELVDELITNRETTTILLNASQDTVAQQRVVERTIETVDETIAGLRDDRRAAERELARLESDLADIVTAIQNAAIGVYTSETQTGVGAIDDIEGYNDRQELSVQVGATLDDLLRRQDDLEAAIAAEQDRIRGIDADIEAEFVLRSDLEAQGEAIAESLDRLTDQIAKLTTRRVEIEQGFPQIIGDAQRARLLATVPVLNVSLVTLDAYVQAAADVGAHYPSCRVRWEILAGIARVESAHATFGGASVAPNGDLSRRILGPLLDGSLENTAVITDTDGGALDGNAEYDAAVGPFQFIPGTWRRHRLDATGDGFADPHNLYDAGLSAAGYLCASSNLADDAGIARSVLSYNRSQKYLADVTGFARSYIVSLALPEAAYDPETIDPSDGWGVHFEDVDPYAQLGQIAPVGTGDPADSPLANTGD